ncbi:MAG: hypothetical protein KY475_14045 [Planctomycetes bacterium]|nr:hypothetical protein [Planctomycetota bacterium]
MRRSVYRIAILNGPGKENRSMIYGYWHFANSIVDDLSFEIEIAGNVDISPGRFYQLYQGKMRGVGFYFGLQTDLYYPPNQWRGRGLIFSRWDTFDAVHARKGENGWIENPKVKEGGFLGVRVPMEWTPGRYFCRIAPSDTDEQGTWYEFTAHNPDTGLSASAGSLRFPAAGIESGGITWTEAYGGRAHVNVSDPRRIPLTDLRVHSISANSGSLAPVRCDTAYDDNVPNSDATFEAGVLILRAGNDVQRIHPATQYALTTQF